MNSRPFFIDFEASSLAFDSYPIEVAWGSNVSNIKSFLISPQGFDDWNDWSPVAQQIHGLTPEYLIQNGKKALVVANEIRKSLENEIVYTDNPDFDCMWMKTLFDAVKMDYPAMNILHFDSLLIETICSDPANRIKELPKIIDIKMAARNKVRIQHRAAYDVYYLIEAWNIAKNYVKNTQLSK